MDSCTCQYPTQHFSQYRGQFRYWYLHRNNPNSNDSGHKKHKDAQSWFTHIQQTIKNRAKIVSLEAAKANIMKAAQKRRCRLQLSWLLDSCFSKKCYCGADLCVRLREENIPMWWVGSSLWNGSIYTLAQSHSNRWAPKYLISVLHDDNNEKTWWSMRAKHSDPSVVFIC